MTDKTSKYDTYTLRQLPVGVFGETYVIVTATEIALGIYKAEYFILTQRPTEAMHMGSIDIPAKSVPAELGIVDTDFTINEAYLQAEIALFLLLEVRANKLERPDLAYLPFELKQIHSPFVGCWMRGRFTKLLMDVKNSTECPVLKKYISLLQQIPILGVKNYSNLNETGNKI